MLKKLKLLFLIIVLMPFIVKANGIENYYIDATVEENGDILVQEYFNLTGKFNGQEIIIYYKDTNLSAFDPNSNSFGGSLIHNGDGIEIIEVRGVPIDSNFSFDNITGDIFTQVPSASKGDYGFYVNNLMEDGNHIMVYNPSNYNKAFYIKYRIKNKAIKHNDVGEIALNVARNTDSINNLKIHLHIPGNTDLRAWAAGPLNGDLNIVDSENALFTISELSKETTIDIRATFDVNVIKESTKITNTDALDRIIVYENEKAKQANDARLQELKNIKDYEIKTEIKNYSYGVILILIILGIGYIIYKKYIQDPKVEFDAKYFRDIPNDYSPEIVSYLFYKKNINRSISASILNLINKKVIIYEKLNSKNYKLKLNENHNKELNDIELRLLDLIFHFRKTVETKSMKKYAKKNYKKFINNWDAYQEESLNRAKLEKFYEEEVKEKKFDWWIMIYIFTFALPILFMFAHPILLGIPLIILFIKIILKILKSKDGYKKLCLILLLLICSGISIHRFTTIFLYQNFYSKSFIIYIISFVLSIILIPFIFYNKKRTKKGAEEYKKWKALKRYLKDFGRFKEKEVPDLILWEKYLVYATLFGCTKKITKVMKVEMINDTDDYNIYSDLYNMNRCILRITKNSHSIAKNTYRAIHNNSSSFFGIEFFFGRSSTSRRSSSRSTSFGRLSSGSGKGGGFSSGSGSFGKGRRGGRF